MDKLDYDFVIVGSGINSLVCAALLAKAGHKVCVLERNDRLGGCIRTEEITLPGFRHEVFSAVHPLVVTSPSLRSCRMISLLADWNTAATNSRPGWYYPTIARWYSRWTGRPMRRP